MDLDLSYQKVNTSQNSTDIENRKISFSEVSQQNSFFRNDAIEILKDMENRKFKKLGNCYIKQSVFFNLRKTIVIGPNYIFFIIGILSFFGFDMFILYSFYDQLSMLLFLCNLIVLSLQLGFYTWCFITDPGIIYKQKADFSDDSTISCSTCYSTDKDKAVHCDDCDLCVSEYDHHCVWIGKCVGKKNYVPFYLFVVNTIVYFVVIIFLSGVINFSKSKQLTSQQKLLNSKIKINLNDLQFFYGNKLNYSTMDNYQEIANISDEPRFGDITIMVNKDQPNIKAMKKYKVCKDQYEFYQQSKEIEIRNQIKHPNIMNILGYKIDKDKRTTSVYYEFPERQLKIKKINNEQIIYFFIDILQGLIYLNSKKMIHGDLRPKYFFFDTDNQTYKIADRLNSTDPPLQTQMKNVYSFKPLYITNMLFNDLINKKKRVKLRPIKNEIFALGIVTLENFIQESEIQKLYDYDKKIFREDIFENLIDRIIEQQTDFYIKQFIQYLRDDVLVMDDSPINKEIILQKVQLIIQNKDQLTSICKSPELEISPIYSQNKEMNFSLSSNGNSSKKLDFSPFQEKGFLRTATFNNSPLKFILFNRNLPDFTNKGKKLQITLKPQNINQPCKKSLINNFDFTYINFNLQNKNDIKNIQINTKLKEIKPLNDSGNQFQVLSNNFYQRQYQDDKNSLNNSNSNLKQFQELLFTFERQNNTPKKKRESIKLKDYLKKSPIVSERQIQKIQSKNPPQKQIVRSFSYAKKQNEKVQKTQKKLQRNQSQILYNHCLQKKHKEIQASNMKQSTVLDNISQMSLFMKRKKKEKQKDIQFKLRDKCIREPKQNNIDKCNLDTPYTIILNDINLKIELKELNLIDIFKKKTLNKRKKSQQIIKLQRLQTQQYDEDIYSQTNQIKPISSKYSTKKQLSSNRQLNPARYRFDFDYEEIRPTIQTHENNYNRLNQPYFNEINNDIISLETITFKNHLNSVKKNKKIYSKNNSPLNTKQSNNFMSNSVLPDIPPQIQRNIRNLRKKNKIRDSQLEKLHEDSSCNLDEFKKMGIKMLIQNCKKDFNQQCKILYIFLNHLFKILSMFTKIQKLSQYFLISILIFFLKSIQQYFLIIYIYKFFHKKWLFGFLQLKQNNLQLHLNQVFLYYNMASQK